MPEKPTYDDLIQLFNMSLDIICIVDIHSATFTKVNPAFTKILGYSVEELVDKPFFEFIHPDDLEATRAVIDEKLKMGAKVINFENRYQCKDGQYRWLSWVSHPNMEKGVTYALARDITNWKESEAALKKSKALLDATGRMARVGGWELDPQSLTVTWTEETYRIHELPRGRKPPLDEAIDYFHPQDRPRLRQAIKRALEHGEPYDMEVRFITARGNHLWTRTVCHPETRDGKTVRLLGVFQDITERKQAEEALHQSRRELQQTLEATTDGIWSWNFKTNTLYFSAKYYTMLGYAPEEFPPTYEQWTRLIHPQDREQALFRASEFLKTKPDVYENQFRMKTKDGGYRWIEASGRVVERDEANEAVFMIGNHEDITRRITAEEEQKLLRNQLNQAQKMESIGSLAGGIAHDFNNILFPIIGMAEILLEDLPEDSPERGHAEEIYRAGKRGSALIKQILAFSRQSEHQMSPLHIKNILGEAIPLLRATIPSYIDIFQNVSSNCGMICADPTHIHQVVMNVMTNAYHAVEKKGGAITVRLAEEKVGQEKSSGWNLPPGKYTVLSISDTGDGIPKENMDRIFDPYFTTKTNGKGTGLGLAVVFGIVKECGGHITVQSDLGKGTTFHIHLPIMDASQDQKRVEPADSWQKGHERILLVDDERPIATLEKMMLQRLGYRVTMRLNSLEALEAFRSNPDAYDLVITDMAMPQMAGDQLAREINAIRPQTPVILCTGFSEKINEVNAHEWGIKGILMKPVIKTEMAKIVRQALDENTMGNADNPFSMGLHPLISGPESHDAP